MDIIDSIIRTEVHLRNFCDKSPLSCLGWVLIIVLEGVGMLGVRCQKSYWLIEVEGCFVLIG